ncbi:hypothetical protein AMAG_17305 [Allomyces macrogynus ATCC 38327]|uniref:Uncharacterized protein n=1 Tax=Allomyces macrogynus (strain ATCC 38327) TaxID=578462 RepID=A0A0L0TED6_ALLM3|nr:hypothetical protein AMAG_17305 [Allomyces macrogynus ATCC 38327]|eukprot:KNE73035.1 hypothetical protein AMAG_17305 [Allomyces macrogynus ATCC 38327]
MAEHHRTVTTSSEISVGDISSLSGDDDDLLPDEDSLYRAIAAHPTGHGHHYAPSSSAAAISAAGSSHALHHPGHYHHAAHGGGGAPPVPQPPSGLYSVPAAVNSAVSLRQALAADPALALAAASSFAGLRLGADTAPAQPVPATPPTHSEATTLGDVLSSSQGSSPLVARAPRLIPDSPTGKPRSSGTDSLIAFLNSNPPEPTVHGSKKDKGMRGLFKWKRDKDRAGQGGVRDTPGKPRKPKMGVPGQEPKFVLLQVPYDQVASATSSASSASGTAEKVGGVGTGVAGPVPYGYASGNGARNAAYLGGNASAADMYTNASASSSSASTGTGTDPQQQQQQPQSQPQQTQDAPPSGPSPGPTDPAAAPPLAGAPLQRSNSRTSTMSRHQRRLASLMEQSAALESTMALRNGTDPAAPTATAPPVRPPRTSLETLDDPVSVFLGGAGGENGDFPPGAAIGRPHPPSSSTLVSSAARLSAGTAPPSWAAHRLSAMSGGTSSPLHDPTSPTGRAGSPVSNGYGSPHLSSGLGSVGRRKVRHVQTQTGSRGAVTREVQADLGPATASASASASAADSGNLTALQLQNTSLQSNVTTLSSEVTQLQAETASLTARLAAAEAELTRARNHAASVEMQYTDLHAAYVHQATLAQQLAEELTETRAELAQKVAEHAQQNDQFEHLSRLAHSKMCQLIVERMDHVRAIDELERRIARARDTLVRHRLDSVLADCGLFDAPVAVTSATAATAAAAAAAAAAAPPPPVTTAGAPTPALRATPSSSSLHTQYHAGDVGAVDSPSVRARPRVQFQGAAAEYSVSAGAATYYGGAASAVGTYPGAGAAGGGGQPPGGASRAPGGTM